MRIYTKGGDDGTTGLLFGGRIPKDSAVISATGAVDEAQAAIGLVRAEVDRGSDLDGRLIGLERDLYVLMAELTTAETNRHKLVGGTTRVTADMVSALEEQIDELIDLFPPLTDFVIPGHDRVSALLDVARTAARRAERKCVAAVVEGSLVVPYVNRLSDLLWTMARWQEQGESLLSRTAGRSPPPDADPHQTPR